MSFSGRVRPLWVRAAATCCLSPQLQHSSFSTPLKRLYRHPLCLETLLSICVLMSLQHYFTRDCGEWGLDRASRLFACRPLPCPWSSWAGVDVLLRENTVNILTQPLWHLEKWDNIIFLFFSPHSLVVCMICRKTLWISSGLYQMSEDTQELAFKTEICRKTDFGGFAVHCCILLVIWEMWSVVL